MMLRFDSQPAYILHTRPYQETSLLIEFFTEDFGRISAVAKGAKRPKSRGRGLLQPFVPLQIACVGRGGLLTLKDFDATAIPILLLGKRLIFAFYLNELLMRLLHHSDAHQELFQYYAKSLRGLRDCGEDFDDCKEQQILRLFEKCLLKELGYDLHLTNEVESGDPLSPNQWYLFDPERGPIKTILNESQVQESQVGKSQTRDISHSRNQPHFRDKSQSKTIFKGSSLLAIAAEQLTEGTILQDAKRLMRLALSSHLGSKPLECRRLL